MRECIKIDSIMSGVGLFYDNIVMIIYIMAIFKNSGTFSFVNMLV